MKKGIDVKSAVIGGLLTLAVVLLVGAAGGVMTGIPTIGRFTLACTNEQCYMVDTATGQAWTNYDGTFKTAKLQDPATAATAAAERFMGRWVFEEPNGPMASLRIEPQGHVQAARGNDRYEGRWHLEGKRLVVNVEEDEFYTELQPDGGLLLWQEGQDDHRMILKKAP
jgi:hypothetical protein